MLQCSTAQVNSGATLSSRGPSTHTWLLVLLGVCRPREEILKEKGVDPVVVDLKLEVAEGKRWVGERGFSGRWWAVAMKQALSAVLPFLPQAGTTCAHHHCMALMCWLPWLSMSGFAYMKLSCLPFISTACQGGDP
jgi:hypothetical protein